MTAPLAAAPARRAGVVTRFAAFLVDALLLAASLRGAAWILLTTQHAFRRFFHPVNVPAIVLASAPIVTALYEVVLWRLYGQTLGKWFMGIKVVSLGGGPVSVPRALVRCVGYVVSALPLYAGFLWILGPARRGWHDLLAGTAVVYAPSGGKIGEEFRPVTDLARV